MSAGLVVLNDENILQIDSEFSNYMLTQSGTASPGSFWGDWPGRPANPSIAVSGNNPIIAIRSTRPMRSFRKMISSNRFEFYVYSGVITGMAGSGDWTFQYYIFDTEMPPTNGDYGLQVFDASGGLVFDSSFGYMKVLEDISRPGLPYPPTGSGLYGIFSDDAYPQETSNLAVVNCQQSFKTDEIVVGEGGMFIYRGIIYGSMYYISGNSAHITCGTEFEVDGSRFGIFLSTPDARVMVIDTTNLPLLT